MTSLHIEVALRDHIHMQREFIGPRRMESIYLSYSLETEEAFMLCGHEKASRRRRFEWNERLREQSVRWVEADKFHLNGLEAFTTTAENCHVHWYIKDEEACAAHPGVRHSVKCVNFVND